MSTSSRVPQYRHHKARGLAVVRIDGQDHYLGPWKSKASCAEYDRLIGEWLARGQVLAPSHSHDAGLAIVEIIAGYTKHAREYYRKSGMLTRECELIKEAAIILRRLYGTTEAAAFGPVALRVVRDAMVEKGWTRKYVNKQVGRIVRMFKWAASLELVPASVYQSLATLDGLKAGRPSYRPGWSL
ncbi:MAG: hypothetical protein KDB23_07915 [Planctomycetales bacterium]|nr:hypothetical protein [Planctomycetales bacterium]